MNPTFVDVRTPAAVEPVGLLAGYAGVVLEVADTARATHFYRDLIGFETEDGRLRLGKAVVSLCERAQPRTMPESGTHQAYRLPRPELEAALQRLAEASVELFGYHEDRLAEREENRYCVDPDGNRLQLISCEAAGIAHAAVET
ncbi:MAG TPA: VOC family protein, partial [Chloroflexota bacterium]|nr:VOC family protein [Chloroflexota bacterium]